MIDLNSKIYLAGQSGLVGAAILKRLSKEGYSNLVLRASNELDLRNQRSVDIFFAEEKPKYVFLAAARVGGILANNTYPAEFIYDNLMIQTNVLNSAYRNKVKKLLFLGSSCIYPKHAPQPLKEEYLLTGPLEPTNEAYAVAKIAGIKMCQAYCRQYGVNYISLMPTNLYGPGDNFDLEGSHVLAALLRKFHEAKMQQLPEVEVWGSGTPRREFLHVDDLAEACLYLMRFYDEPDIINVGVGRDLSIAELAQVIGKVVGYEGKIRFNRDMPDGTHRKLLDVSRIEALGWRAKYDLEEGLVDTYRWFKEHNR